MGLNKVTVEIRFNAEKEAQRILAEGRAEGERILGETRKRLKEFEESVGKERDASLEQIGTKSQTVFQKRMKEAVMEIKKEAVEKVYQRFLESLEGVKGGEKERLFRKMMASARKQIERPETVYVRREDAPLAKALFRGLQVRTKDISGGFLLESGDGSEVVDYSFDMLVELLKGRTLKDVSKKLFGE
jgi:vacuolar-type H+-ATPase subunit E/Vma4